MASEKRPYGVTQRPEMEAIAKANWNSKPVLKALAHELSFRHKTASLKLRDLILKRLRELEKGLAVELESESVRGEGPESTFLEYLGYCVTKGLNLTERQKLLDTIYGQNLPPEVESKRCGKALSATRRLLIVECLSEHLKNARRRGDTTPTEWMKSWKADLKYVQEKYF
jgi:hypothetical protein